jgi:hypothetical protein
MSDEVLYNNEEMTQPLQPDLWNLTLLSVKAARAAGLQYVESGKFASRREVPKYEENSQGWSTTTSGRTFGSSDAGPINWKYMFGEKKGTLTYIGIDEIPVLAAGVEQVLKISMDDPEFEKKLVRFPLGDPGSEERQGYLRSTFISFVTDIISRAEATGAYSDNELLAIYLPLERARFAEQLSGDVVVPIALTALNATEPLELAPDVWIEPLDKKMQMARAVDWQGGGRVSPYVIAAATHAVVIRDVTLDNRDPFLRWRNAEDDIDVTRVNLALQCLHIARGREAGYAQILVRPKDWADSWVHDLPAVARIGEYHRYPHRFDQAAWTQEKILVQKNVVGQLPQMFKALEGAEENVRVAARRALNTVLRSDDEDVTLDATIGLECLLGGGDKTEITHRIAQRAAAALVTEDWTPGLIYTYVKKIYSHRSAIVHGVKDKDRVRTASIQVGETKYSTSSVARWILRALLSNLLLADQAWTPRELDERILSALLPPRADSKG